MHTQDWAEVENKCFNLKFLAELKRFKGRNLGGGYGLQKKTPDCGCKLSLECKQTNTCNFLADVWSPWHIHMHTHTHIHTREQTNTQVNHGGYTHSGRWRKTWMTSLHIVTVTDSNSEVRRHINLNHLTYCSGWMGGWGVGGLGLEGHKESRWEINWQKVTEREREQVGENKLAGSANASRQFFITLKQDINKHFKIL